MSPDPSQGPDVVRVTMFVRGWVQGVGFRWWVRARALELGLVGHARNLTDGRVEVVVQGDGDAVARLEKLVREQPSTSRRPGHVETVVVQPASRGTESRASTSGDRPRLTR